MICMHKTLVREIQEEASRERHPVHGQGTQCGDVCQSSHHGMDRSFCGYQKHKSKVNIRRPLVHDIQKNIGKQTKIGRLP